MICRECQPVLEEYLDGELGAKVAEEVAAHLATCNPCTAELNQLRSELALFQGNSREIDVTEDLWASVRARLEVQKSPFLNQRNSGLYGWLAGVLSAPRISLPVTVALVLMAVVVTAFVVNRISQSEKENLAVESVKNVDNMNGSEDKTAAQRTVAKTPERLFSSPEGSKLRRLDSKVRSSTVSSYSQIKTPEQLVREAEKKYLVAIGMLSRDIERRQSQLDPDTRIKLEQALASIDRTIGATRKAVREHPEDPVAVQYMLAAYARKVDVLREMAGGGTFQSYE
jgi:hypothetical protein